jgi:hypothetical protein
MIFSTVQAFINHIKDAEPLERKISLLLVFVPVPYALTLILQIAASFNFGFIGVVTTLAMYDIPAFRREDQLIKDERDLAEKTAISNHFLKSFTTGYYANLETNELQLLSVSGPLKDTYDLNITSFDETFAEYIEVNVHPQDREKVKRDLTREYIRNRLQKLPDFSFTYRDTGKVAPGTYRCTVIRGNDGDHVAIAFLDITEELKRQEILNEKAESAEHYIETIVKNTISPTL